MLMWFITCYCFADGNTDMVTDNVTHLSKAKQQSHKNEVVQGNERRRGKQKASPS